MALNSVKPTRSEDPYASFMSGSEADYGPMAPTEWGMPLEAWKLRASQTGRPIDSSASGDPGSGGDVISGEFADDASGGGGELDESGGGKGGAF